MRPIKLEIEGIHSFVEKQIVDFNRLSGHGIFGIFGPTGSGKSTILDSIVLALYGKIARSKTNNDFINSSCSKAKVDLTFSFVEHKREKIFEIERCYKKKSNNEIDQTAEVFEVSPFGKTQLVEGPSKVDAFVKNLLSMSENEFSKCIALPQGEFAGFLKSKPNERVGIIGNLFDLNNYGQPLYDKASSRLDKLKNEYDKIASQIDVFGIVDVKELTKTETAIEEENANLDSKKLQLSKKLDEKKEIEKTLLINQEKKEIEKKLVGLNELAKSIDEERKLFEKYKLLQSSGDKITREIDLQKEIAQRQSNIDRCQADLAKLTGNDGELDKQYELKKRELEDSLENEKNKLQSVKGLIASETKLNKLKLDLKTQNDVLKEKIVVEKNAEKEANKCQLDLSQTEILVDNTKSDLEKINAKLSELDLAKSFKDFSREIETIDLIDKQFDELSKNVEFDEKKHKLELQTYNELDRDFVLNLKKVDDNISKLIELDDGQFDQLTLNIEKKLLQFELANSQLLSLDDRIMQLRIENEERIENIEKFRKDNQKLNNDLLEIQQKKQFLNEKLCNSQLEREGVLGANIFAELSDRIKIGEDCPLCKSTVIQKNKLEKFDISGVEVEIEKIKSALAGADEVEHKIRFDIASNTTRIEDNLSKIKFNQKIEKDLDGKKQAIYVKFVDLSDGYKNKFEDNYNKAKKARSSADELLALRKKILVDIEKNNNNKLETSVKIAGEEKFAEMLLKISEFVSGVRAEKTLLISNCDNTKIDLQNFFEDLANAQKSEKLIRSQLEKHTNKLLELQKKFGEASTLLVTVSADRKNTEDKLSNIELQINELSDAIGNVIDGTVEDNIIILEKSINKYKIDLTQNEIEHNTKVQRVAELSREIEIENAMLESLKNEQLNLMAALDEIATNAGIENRQELENNLLDSNKYMVLENRIKDFDNNYMLAQNELKKLQSKLADKSFTENDKITKQKEISALQSEISTSEQHIGALGEALKKLRLDFDKTKELRDKLLVADKKYQLAKELVSMLKGKALLEYVAEEIIDDISYLASNKLQVLFDGRYELKYENKEFFIVDNFFDGTVRPVSTLSGGETFVVSLALALSISDAIIANSEKSMDFFFLDEGFGSLDRDYCEYIVNALLKLEKNNLTIGLISHVPELKELIRDKLIVKKPSSSVGTTIFYQNDL